MAVKKSSIAIPWIKDGKCTNDDGRNICNLGYACDGCPYNVS